MRKILAFLALCSCIHCGLQAQTKFFQGYFIDNAGNRVECLIRSETWRYNPAEFQYKLNENDEPVTATVDQVKEFGLTEGNRFVSQEVMVDISSEDPGDLSDKSDPEWMKMRLFLSVLVEGKATLYKYKTPRMLRFFYSTVDQPLQQLVFKSYRNKNENDIIQTNFYFRIQLWNTLNYPGNDEGKTNRVSYDEVPLVKYFTEYNLSKGENRVYHKRKDKGAFHLTVTPGLVIANTSGVQLVNGMAYENSEEYSFGTQVNFRIGASFELVFPNTNKKVSMLLEPVYRSYNQSVFFWGDTITADFHMIEIPVGFRYYAFLSNDLRVFGDVFVCLTPFFFIPGSDIQWNHKEHSEAPEKSGGISFGAGAAWKRFSGEFRYNLPRKITAGSVSAKYSNFEFIAGFRIF